MFSGSHGSGAVFFSGCNLSCLFCQNYEISAYQKGSLCQPERLAEIFLQLQAQDAHNINLVTPTPHLLAIRTALKLAKAQGLHLPVLYNTNAYERVESLQSLEGLVDIYLPDLKYVSPAFSKRLSGAEDYFDFAAPAIQEMQRQVGLLQLDNNGIAVRGLLIRHLVLPGCLEETRFVLNHISQALPQGTWLSLMRQYTPAGNIAQLPSMLKRTLTEREYQRAVQYCLDLGMEHVLLQEKEAANCAFTPAFENDLPALWQK